MGHGDGRSHGAKLNLRARLAYLAAAVAGVAVLTGLPLGNAAVGNTALQLNGSSQYATLGASGDLQSATFTVELWFQRTGAGTPTSTGTGGITNAIPLITKGRAEAETAAADVNYFLGIDATSGKLVADFEEGQSGSTPSANHPITGTTAIPIGSAWHHAAATYDGAAWNLYLDGALDGTLTVNKPANAATTSRTAVGSALTTASVAAGFFAGVVDEVRIWNSARTLAQIQATKNTEITAPQSGLLGVWNLNEGTGSSLADNSGNGKTGAAIASPAWVAGFVPPGANNPPVAVADSYSTPQSTTLTVAAPGVLANDTDPESNPLTAIKVTDPAHGTLTLASNGSVNYVPTPGYNGPDSFTYKANDGTADSNTVTVSLTVTAPAANTALQLNGSSQYATLGASGDLQSATFTVELWFQRTGAGTPTSTGTGGITNAIPLITKGRAEAETAAADVNYFLGIDATSGKLVADFEEGQSGSTPSANHPITGTTAIPIGSAWHHAAATYDGAAWNLYLDGALDGTLTVNKPANAATTSRTAVGSALTTASVAAGFFAGVVDEVRIWNSARTLAQIQATKNTEITAPQLRRGARCLEPERRDGQQPGRQFRQRQDGRGDRLPRLGGRLRPARRQRRAGRPDPECACKRRHRGRSLADARHRRLRPRRRPADRHVLRPPARERQLRADRPAHRSRLGHERHRDLGGPRRRPDATSGTRPSTTAPTPPPARPGPSTPSRAPTRSSSAPATSPIVRRHRGHAIPGNIITGIDGNVFTTGDNVYPSGTAAEFTNCYAPTPWGSPSVKSRTRPVPGNHDWGTRARPGQPGRLQRLLRRGRDRRQRQELLQLQHRRRSNWHIVNLDSECELVPGGCAAGSAQELWLKADLAANSTQERDRALAQAALQLGRDEQYQALQPLWDDLYAAGVDILLDGHDHIYERIAR